MLPDDLVLSVAALIGAALLDLRQKDVRDWASTNIRADVPEGMFEDRIDL